ncbi:hypothetical protein QE152_g24449 [Popillia japonica]|uniref:Peptidase A2 domain-containing protein n=1 Tax=Popillia japonica TaxID=7064 RepID=A0AAW1KFD1_POPJA
MAEQQEVSVLEVKMVENNFCKAIESSKSQAQVMAEQQEVSVLEVKMVENKEEHRKNCINCGYQHLYGKCPAFRKTCAKCQKQNHLQRWWKTTSAVYSINMQDTMWIQKVQINNKIIDFKLDTGAEINVLPLDVLNSITGLTQLSPSNISIIAYGSKDFKIKSKGIVKDILLVDGRSRHRQSQVSVERANSAVKHSLIAWMRGNNTSPWSCGLRFVQWGINSTYHEAIKMQPCKAMFGKVNGIEEAAQEERVTEEEQNDNEHPAVKFRQAASENILKQATRKIARSKKKLCPLAIRDNVLLDKNRALIGQQNLIKEEIMSIGY